MDEDVLQFIAPFKNIIMHICYSGRDGHLGKRLAILEGKPVDGLQAFVELDIYSVAERKNASPDVFH